MPNTKLLPAEELLAKPLYNNEGQELGVLKHILIDPALGDIGYIIVSVSEFLGAEKLVAVPWNSLNFSRDGRVILDADKERLDAAPGFDHDHFPQLSPHEFYVPDKRQKKAANMG